jgi:hypothetical protein
VDRPEVPVRDQQRLGRVARQQLTGEARRPLGGLVDDVDAGSGPRLGAAG